MIAAGTGTLSNKLTNRVGDDDTVAQYPLRGFGAAVPGKPFQIYTLATWVVFIIFGVLTFGESWGVGSGLPHVTRPLGTHQHESFLSWVTSFADKTTGIFA